ncbi:MAG TPA: Gfo/Idh/MocA family oxidoreductase [Saprospiraceae bacterium]|nr:Gfo/Idh/MocA family oxidoreductase [Saprospiraceae bacterium]
MRNKKIGLLGYGIWGHNIHLSLNHLNAFVYVYDPDPGRITKALQWGAESTTHNFQQFLQLPVDAWIVASPSTTHFSIIEELTLLNLPIFVEKPLVTRIEEAQKLKNKNYSNIFVMHIWKYHPGIQMLADIAKSMNLGMVKGGKSVRVNWTSPRLDTDSLWNMAIHDLSISESLLGEIPPLQSVLPEIHNGNIRGLSVHLGHEPYYHFEVSNRYPDKRREVILFCEEGVAVLRDEKVHHIDIFEGNDKSSLSESSHYTVAFDPTPPLEIELQVFLNYLKGGPPPPTDLDEAVRLIKALDSIEKLIFLKSE